MFRSASQLDQFYSLINLLFMFDFVEYIIFKNGASLWSTEKHRIGPEVITTVCDSNSTMDSTVYY